MIKKKAISVLMISLAVFMGIAYLYTGSLNAYAMSVGDKGVVDGSNITYRYKRGKILSFSGGVITSGEAFQDFLYCKLYKYVIDDTYPAIISFDGEITSGEDASEASFAWMFAMDKNLQEVRGLENLKIKNIRSINSMFMNCSSITKIDLSGPDLSNVTDLDNIFEDCKALRDVNFGNIDGSKLKKWSYLRASSGHDYIEKGLGFKGGLVEFLKDYSGIKYESFNKGLYTYTLTKKDGSKEKFEYREDMTGKLADPSSNISYRIDENSVLHISGGMLDYMYAERGNYKFGAPIKFTNFSHIEKDIQRNYPDFNKRDIRGVIFEGPITNEDKYGKVVSDTVFSGAFKDFSNLEFCDMSGLDLSVLRVGCWDNMFAGCSRLKKIIMPGKGSDKFIYNEFWSQANSPVGLRMALNKTQTTESGYAGIKNFCDRYSSIEITDEPADGDVKYRYTLTDRDGNVTSHEIKREEIYGRFNGTNTLYYINGDTMTVTGNRIPDRSKSYITDDNKSYDPAVIQKMIITTDTTAEEYSFAGYKGLKNIDGMNHVTFRNAYKAFEGDTSLERLDLSENDMSSVSNYHLMLENCTSLQELSIGKVSKAFGNVTQLWYHGPEALEHVISSLGGPGSAFSSRTTVKYTDPEAQTNAYHIPASSITYTISGDTMYINGGRTLGRMELYLLDYDKPYIGDDTDKPNLFGYGEKLYGFYDGTDSIGFYGYPTEGVKLSFDQCDKKAIRHIVIKDDVRADNMNGTFKDYVNLRGIEGCAHLKINGAADIEAHGNWFAAGGRNHFDLSNMFENCSKLEKVDLSDTYEIDYASNIFEGATSLKEFTISSGKYREYGPSAGDGSYYARSSIDKAAENKAEFIFDKDPSIAFDKLLETYDNSFYDLFCAGKINDPSNDKTDLCRVRAECKGFYTHEVPAYTDPEDDGVRIDVSGETETVREEEGVSGDVTPVLLENVDVKFSLVSPEIDWEAGNWEQQIENDPSLAKGDESPGTHEWALMLHNGNRYTEHIPVDITFYGDKKPEEKVTPDPDLPKPDNPDPENPGQENPDPKQPDTSEEPEQPENPVLPTPVEPEPDNPTPDIPDPVEPVSEETEHDIPEPISPEPDAPAPDTPEPEEPAQVITEPETPEPDTTESEPAEPDTTFCQPQITIPQTSDATPVLPLIIGLFLTLSSLIPTVRNRVAMNRLKRDAGLTQIETMATVPEQHASVDTLASSDQMMADSVSEVKKNQT